MASRSPLPISRPLIAIAGATGTGKSILSIEVAERIGGEIVNFDSVQVVRGFDIGSAKPSPAERARVPHHLIDVVDPGDELNAADFARLAEIAIHDIDARGRTTILVGGTGFWLRALLAGLPDMPERDETFRRRVRAIWDTARGPAHLRAWLARVDPEASARIAPADRHRIERALEVWNTTGRPISSFDAPTATSPERWPSLKFALDVPRPVLNRKLDERVDAMYARGIVDETRSLLERFPGTARTFDSIGYREAVAVVRGESSPDDAVAETKRRTRAYAKRQLTWLRAQPGLIWLDASDGIDRAVSVVVERVGRWAARSAESASSPIDGT